MRNAIDMTKGKPLGVLVRFGTPLMLTSILRQLYTLCDSLIIGRLLGIEAFAAIG
ncbi:MAG: oligosaccharide flippase family protein, partial [Oscillospiraceae bacterium]|nr:oligosaccharide flippase family protein [Oscillospiraceae bacterium]